jgi:hypothetical protein
MPYGIPPNKLKINTELPRLLARVKIESYNFRRSLKNRKKTYFAESYGKITHQVMKLLIFKIK